MAFVLNTTEVSISGLAQFSVREEPDFFPTGPHA